MAERRVKVWRQVADDLRSKIDAGLYRPGSRLPKSDDLMTHYGISRQTLQTAIDTLRRAGLIAGGPGRGWYVAEPPPKFIRDAGSRLARAERQAGRAAFYVDTRAWGAQWAPAVDVEITRQLAPAEFAATLGTGPVIVRDRVMRTGQVVTQLATSWIPADLAAGTAIECEDTGPGGTYARLEEAGHALTVFTEHVTVRDPTDREAELLAVPSGRTVVEITRYAHSGDRIVEITRATIPADRVELVYTWTAD